MRIRNNAGRLILLTLLAIGILAAWHWRGVFDPASLTALIDSSPAAPLVFIGLHIVASLVFVPRTLLALGAGLVFGMWWGALWAALGSLSGAIAGFLRYNFNPASIFLGDSGALFVGFGLAALSVLGSQKATTAVAAPARNRSAASPRLVAPEAHAVEIVNTGPIALNQRARFRVGPS